MKKINFMRLSAGVAGVIFGLLPAAGYAEPTTTLPNGANLSVQIDNPLNNEEFNVPPGQANIDTLIKGEASIGKGIPSIGLIVVVDNSGSTSGGGGSCGTILNCEKAAVGKLLEHSESVAEFGIVVFGSNAVTSDMQQANGDQLTTNSSADATTVDNSITSSGVSKFTAKSSGGGTNYSDALEKATEIAQAMSSPTKLVVFLSDGYNGTGSFAAELSELQNHVDTIYPFAIGNGASCTGGYGGGSLSDMGSCQNASPEDLANLLPNLLATTLQSVDVSVDGAPLTSTQTPSVPADGPVSVEYNATAAGLAPGTYNICAKATGFDNAGSADVSECVDIHLLQLTASPDSAENDLNSETSHTVTAEIVGGSGPARNINFTVSGQNSASGLVSTLPNKEVNFTYSVPKSCSSLGEDNITVSTTIGGETVSIPLKKTWIDKTPPAVSCDPSVNPGGKMPQAPGKGGQGQNQDGFYQLNTKDQNLTGCTVTLKVADGSGFVYPGPFMPGDTIKYTESNGKQQQKKMGGTKSAVKWHLVGHGDLTVTATDPSGNQSSAKCLVPKAPK